MEAPGKSIEVKVPAQNEPMQVKAGVVYIDPNSLPLRVVGKDLSANRSRKIDATEGAGLRLPSLTLGGLQSGGPSKWIVDEDPHFRRAHLAPGRSPERDDQRRRSCDEMLHCVHVVPLCAPSIFRHKSAGS